jgi:hypothetical protein
MVPHPIPKGGIREKRERGAGSPLVQSAIISF